jgi:hypothetical protein
MDCRLSYVDFLLLSPIYHLFHSFDTFIRQTGTAFREAPYIRVQIQMV